MWIVLKVNFCDVTLNFVILFSNFHILKRLGISPAKVKASTSIPDSVHGAMKPHFNAYPHTGALASFGKFSIGPSHCIFQPPNIIYFYYIPSKFPFTDHSVLTTRDFSRLNYYIQQMLKKISSHDTIIVFIPDILGSRALSSISATMPT